MRLPTTIPRGVTTVDDLRLRSIRDPLSCCWLWQGATSGGKAAIWTFDHARGEKRVMSGPMAVWNIAYDAAPRPGWMVFAGCGNSLCVNPAHTRQVPSRTEYGAYVRARGWLVGVAVEAKRESLRKARKARGVVDTPPEIVAQVRAMTETAAEIASRLGITRRVVYEIRRKRRLQAGAGAEP